MSHLDDLIAIADRARLAVRMARMSTVPLPTLIDPLTDQPWSEEQVGGPSTTDLPALPEEAILGNGYVRRPAAEPIRAGSCALCQDCPHRLAAVQTPATGASA